MMLSHALAARALGPVFPCKGKRPATSNGFHAGSTDEAEIRACWEEMPGANPAFANGETITIDVDSSREKNKFGDCELMELVRDRGSIPRTLQVITPSLGAHFHYRKPAGATIRRQCPGLGSKWIDVLGTGGYCMAPGSNIEGLGSYEVVDDYPIAELSGWLLDAILASQSAAEPETSTAPSPRLGHYRKLDDRLDRALKYIDKMPEAISGSGGHVATWRVACVLVHRFELPDEAATEVLRYYSRRCSPPWSDAELRHKLDQAKKNATTYSTIGAFR